MIEFRAVHKLYPATRSGEAVAALSGFTLTVARGEFVCLIGPSGCGKTTALRVVNRLVSPTAGEIWFDGVDVGQQDPIALRRRIGYVIQSGGLFPHLRVADNIALLCRLAGHEPQAISRRVAELLELVRLPASEFAGRYPKELSGGQRQRVGVARALALDPPCILLDEPFSALDPITRGQLQSEFSTLVRELGKTVLMVTHDLDEAFRVAHRIAVVRHGEVEQVGSREELIAQPATTFVRSFVHDHVRRPAEADAR